MQVNGPGAAGEERQQALPSKKDIIMALAEALYAGDELLNRYIPQRKKTKTWWHRLFSLDYDLDLEYRLDILHLHHYQARTRRARAVVKLLYPKSPGYPPIPLEVCTGGEAVHQAQMLRDGPTSPYLLENSCCSACTPSQEDHHNPLPSQGTQMMSNVACTPHQD